MSQFTEISSALSADARVKILQMLRGGRLCVNALTCRLGISQPAVSQHLRVLESAGLVKGKKVGFWVHYTVNDKALANYRKALDKILTSKK